MHVESNPRIAEDGKLAIYSGPKTGPVTEGQSALTIVMPANIHTHAALFPSSSADIRETAIVCMELDHRHVYNDRYLSAVPARLQPNKIVQVTQTMRRGAQSSASALDVNPHVVLRWRREFRHG
jgi:hypothetical protein